MRRTIIGISTSSSLKQVNILEQIRPSGTLRQTVPIVGIWSSAQTVQLFCLSAQQFQRHFPVNNTGSYASEWKPSGRKRRPLFREINWITPTKRAKQGSSGSSSCIGVPCKQEARRITFPVTKTMISRGANSISPIFPDVARSQKFAPADENTRESPRSENKSSTREEVGLAERRNAITLKVLGRLHSTPCPKWVNPPAISELILFA